MLLPPRFIKYLVIIKRQAHTKQKRHHNSYTRAKMSSLTRKLFGVGSSSSLKQQVASTLSPKSGRASQSGKRNKSNGKKAVTTAKTAAANGTSAGGGASRNVAISSTPFGV